jgi:hypothetical protein
VNISEFPLVAVLIRLDLHQPRCEVLLLLVFEGMTISPLSLSLSLSLLASCRTDLGSCRLDLVLLTLCRTFLFSMLRIPSVLLSSHGEERRGGVCEEGEATRGDSVSGYPPVFLRLDTGVSLFLCI